MEKCCLKKTAGLVGGAFMAALFALVALAFFSCSNMSGGGESSSKNSYPVVRFVANMQSDLATAPQEISGLVSASAGTESFCDDGISRSAMPDVEITFGTDIGVKYYVEAVTGTVGTDSYKRHFVSGTSSTLELPLESGRTWNVTCGIGALRAISAPSGGMEYHVQTVYMSDNDPSVTISPDNPVYTKTFGLKPSTEGSGKVDLTFYVDSETGINDASCLVVECDGLNIAADFTKAYGSGKIVFSTDYGKTIPSGSYEFVIKFLSSSGVLVYATSQTINVFDNMTTSVWSDDGSGAFETRTVDGKQITAFHLDQDLVTKFVDNTIYVGATGFGLDPNDDNAGTAFTPLAKLDTAFTRIAANGNGKDYRIYIYGTLDEPNMTVSGGINGKAASITIEGYNGLGTDGNPKDKILGKAFGVGDKAALNIATSVPITTKNIWLAKKEGQSGDTRGLYLQSGANVTLGPGTVISGFNAGRDYDGCSGGGVYVASGAALTVKGAVIKDNYAYEGGGLCVAGDGDEEINISGSQITGNHACYGGAISVENAEVNITKTTISGNYADINSSYDHGGGLTLGVGADVTLGSGAVVQDNTARFGGGVDMCGGTLTLDGGQINENHAVKENANTDGCGGGIYFNQDSCKIYVYDGSISGNTAANLGGGIRFDGNWVEEESDHLLHITGGTIENNKAAKGGAMYIYPTNWDDVDRHFTFNLGGSAYIPYGVNGADGEGKNDIFFDGPNGSTYASIVLQSALTKHSETNPIAIRINEGSGKRGVGVVQASSSLEKQKDSFKLFSEDWNLKLSSDKKSLVLDSPIWVAGTDAQQCTGTPSVSGPGTKSHPYDSIEHACAAMTDTNVEYTILIDGTLTAKQSFKSCRAASINIEGANGLYPAGHEKAGEPMDAIDGSGIASSQKDYMLYIGWAFDITIKNLKITGGDRSGNRNEGNIEGGGIFLSSGKTLTLSSGTLITKNKAGHGGGVYVQDSTLVIEDGAKITKNTATGGGAVYNFGGGVYLKKNNGKPVLKMAGGEISGNSARKGGGVCLYYASFFMYGNAIIGADLPEGQVGSSDTDKGCNTANCGGGIYLEGSDVYLGYEDANEDGSPKTPHKLEKGVIGNYSYGISDTATTYGGGGIYWSYNSSGKARIYMASGQIAKNAAEQKGGAIYYYSGSNTDSTLTIGGDASIPALAGANDVCLLSPATLAGALTKHGASNPITITPEGGKMTHGATVFKTDPERVLTSDDLKCFKLSAEQEDAGLALTLSSDCKSVKLDKPIFVKQGGTPSGSGTANGTKTKPYGSIEDACKKGMTSDSLDYTIKVIGNLEANQKLVNNNTSSITAKSITIMGADDLDENGVPQNAIIGGETVPPAAALALNYALPVTIKNLKITGGNNNASGSSSAGTGGGINSSKANPLTISSGTLISGNTAKQGAGIYQNGGKLVIEDGAVISGNTAVGYYNDTFNVLTGGGGVALANGAVLDMGGGKITGNKVENAERLVMGGGVVCLNSSKIFMYGSAVIGGVDASDPKTPTSISSALAAGGNVACGTYYSDTNAMDENAGAGIAVVKGSVYLGYKPNSSNNPVEATGEERLTGGVLGNYSSNGCGGGIYLKDSACNLNIANGNVSYNYAYSSGGGVYNAGDFTMAGGEIYGNSVSGSDGTGGGVTNAYIFTMKGGKIYANDGGLLGGGVYQSSGSSGLYLSGDAVIGDSSKPNVAKQGGGIGCKEDVASLTRIGWLDGTVRYNFTGGLMGNRATAGSGGAIYMNKSSKLYFYSGRISGNTASVGKGNGVYVHPEATAMEMRGYVRFDASDDIWLAPPESGDPKTITISNDSVSGLHPTDTGASGGTPADKTATITPGAYNPGDTILTGTGTLVSDNYDKFALAQDASDPSQTWILDSDGCIYGSQPVLAIDLSNGMTSQDRAFITGKVVGIGTEDNPYVLELGGLDTLKFQIKGGLGKRVVHGGEGASNRINIPASYTSLSPNYASLYNQNYLGDGIKIQMVLKSNYDPSDHSNEVHVPFWILVRKPQYFMGTPYTADGSNVKFGDFPQTIKESSVNLSSTIQVQQQQDGVAQHTYYLGDDGSWYCEQDERGCTEYGTIKYSDGETTVGTGGSTSKWFKVEPIEWKLLNSSSGTRLLHAKNILEGMHFDTSANVYADSVIRIYMNGSFFNSAFSPSLREKIRDTTIDGVTDKLFLFSKDTVATFEEYFPDDNARIRFSTDFAKATGAAVPSYSTGGGMWWTRDFDEINNVYFVNSDGRTNDACSPSRSYVGLAPAMWVKLY